MSWDNTPFRDSNKLLMMKVSDRIALVDMKKVASLTFPPGAQQFKIFYGDEQYIKSESLDKLPRVGEFYPNPVKRTGEVLSLLTSLPSGTVTVTAAVQPRRRAARHP